MSKDESIAAAILKCVASGSPSVVLGGGGEAMAFFVHGSPPCVVWAWRSPDGPEESGAVQIPSVHACAQ